MLVATYTGRNACIHIYIHAYEYKDPYVHIYIYIYIHINIYVYMRYSLGFNQDQPAKFLSPAMYNGGIGLNALPTPYTSGPYLCLTNLTRRYV
jgi:hypothetical protein